MKKLLLSLFTVLVAQFAIAQCDITADICQDHITGNYLSDGQHYRALLLENQVAEFNATLYGGSTYRFAACS
jgi:hypothetical protein